MGQVNSLRMVIFLPLLITLYIFVTLFYSCCLYLLLCWLPCIYFCHVLLVLLTLCVGSSMCVCSNLFLISYSWCVQSMNSTVVLLFYLQSFICHSFDLFKCVNFLSSITPWQKKKKNLSGGQYAVLYIIYTEAYICRYNDLYIIIVSVKMPTNKGDL